MIPIIAAPAAKFKGNGAEKALVIATLALAKAFCAAIAISTTANAISALCSASLSLDCSSKRFLEAPSKDPIPESWF